MKVREYMTFKYQFALYDMDPLQEKHAKKPTSGIDAFFTDKKTHLFTLGLLLVPLCFI